MPSSLRFSAIPLSPFPYLTNAKENRPWQLKTGQLFQFEKQDAADRFLDQIPRWTAFCNQTNQSNILDPRYLTDLLNPAKWPNSRKELYLSRGQNGGILGYAIVSPTPDGLTLETLETHPILSKFNKCRPLKGIGLGTIYSLFKALMPREQDVSFQNSPEALGFYLKLLKRTPNHLYDVGPSDENGILDFNLQPAALQSIIQGIEQRPEYQLFLRPPSDAKPA